MTERRWLAIAGLAWGMMALPVAAQNQAPPPKPVNSATGTAGFTRPGTVEAEGPSYVGPIMTKWGR